MKIPSLLCLIFTFILFNSCTPDDEIPQDEFYQGVKTDVTWNDITGRWAAFQVRYNGQIHNLNPQYSNCGYNFFDFEMNQYTEYIITTSNCDFQQYTYQLSLEQGILTISDSSNETDRMAITSVTANNMEVNYRGDINNDGNLEVYSLLLMRYTAPETIGNYSPGFSTSTQNENLIELTWNEYEGIDVFEKYEITRVAECQGTEEVIATITDKTITNFVDLDPPVADQICYKLNVSADNNTTFTSDISLNTYSIGVPAIEGFEIQEGNELQLSWQAYTGEYFDHYEIRLSRGYYNDYELVAKLEDKSQTTITLGLPFIENANYTIVAVNIFGRSSYERTQEVSQLNPMVMNADRVFNFEFDPSEPYVVYFADNGIHKYNYESREVVHTIAQSWNTGFVDLQIHDTAGGKELWVVENSKIKVYNYNNFQLLFTFDPPYEEVRQINNFVVKQDRVIFVDHQKIYNYQRGPSGFTFVESYNHFNNTSINETFVVTEINPNLFLVGSEQRNNSYSFALMNSGNLTSGSTFDMPLQASYNSQLLYGNNVLLNTKSNKVFATNTFNLLYDLEDNITFSTFSSEGNQLWAVNGIGTENFDSERKKVSLYNLSGTIAETYNSQGYSKYIFEREDGMKVSFSSGTISNSGYFKRYFVETIETN